MQPGQSNMEWRTNAKARNVARQTARAAAAALAGRPRLQPLSLAIASDQIEISNIEIL